MFPHKLSPLYMLIRLYNSLFFKQDYLLSLKNWWRESLSWLNNQFEVIPARDLLKATNASDNLLSELEWKMGKTENDHLHINTHINHYQ